MDELKRYEWWEYDGNDGHWVCVLSEEPERLVGIYVDQYADPGMLVQYICKSPHCVKRRLAKFDLKQGTLA
jgi:hypothetical protein